MSLFSQIQTLVASLLLVCLVVVFRINFNSARQFSADQTFDNAKNVANVLALTLQARAADSAYVQTSINAMFDGGYFETISLVRTDGTEVYTKSEPLAAVGVPDLFIRWVALKIPAAEALVMDGWTVFGTLRVQGHTGHAYRKLWTVFKQLCLLFTLLGAISIALSYAMLKQMLKALEKIRHQAEALAGNTFIVNPEMPRTPELKKVVLAMNTMVEKVRTIYDRHLDQLVRYKALGDRDAATGLANRDFFVNTFNQMLKDAGPGQTGRLVLLAVSGLNRVNASGGAMTVQRLYKRLAAVLEETAEAVNGALLARLPRDEFAMVLPGCTEAQGRGVAEAAAAGFSRAIEEEPDSAGRLAVFGGMAEYRGGDDLKTVLSKADYALSTARSRLTGRIETYRHEQGGAVLGKAEWKSMLEEAFAENRFSIAAQPVMGKTGLFHREVFVSMANRKGDWHRAGWFMPMVKALGMADRLDKHILALAAGHLVNHPQDVLAVNVTTDFCTDRTILPWLRRFLAEHRSRQDRLMFEIHENTLIQHTEICLDFAGLLTEMGSSFGLDQFTMNDAALRLLERMKPQYIKIERDDLEVFDAPQISDMVLSALFTISHSLGIRLIATKVENKAQRRALEARNIQYFQGRGIAGVTPLGKAHE